MPGGTWALLIGHDDVASVSWAGLRPRVELRRFDGRLFVYKPAFSGHMHLGPLLTHGRVLTFSRAA